MRDIFRSLRFLALLAALAWAGDAALAWLAEKALLRSQNRFSRLYAGAAEADALALGNSRAVNAFHVPEAERRTGARWESLAYNGVSMEVAECLLRDHLARHPAPRRVFVEATALTGGPAVAAKLSPFFGRSPCLEALAAPMLPSGIRVSRLSPFNSEFFLRSFAFGFRDDRDWVNPGRLTPAMEAALRRAPKRTWRVAERNARALARMAELCREAGTELLVVMAPMHPAGRDRHANLALWTEEARTTCEAAGVPFFDYTRALDGCGDCFADGIHLTRAGSAALLDVMEADGIVDVQRAR